MEGVSEDAPEGMAVGRLVGTAVGLYFPLRGHGGGWRPEGGLRGGGHVRQMTARSTSRARSLPCRGSGLGRLERN